MERIPREGGKRFWKIENFSSRIEMSPGSTRAAAGVCVIEIVRGGRGKNPQRRREKVLGNRKF